MKKNLTPIPIPISGGLNSEPSSASLLSDGEWYTLVNCRPYQGSLIRRYGDKLLGNALTTLSPLGLFFFNAGGTDTLFLMTTTDATNGGVIKWISTAGTTWADVATNLHKSNPWTACKLTNAENNVTYALFSNNSDDIVTWDASGGVASNLTTISGTAPHRPTKAKCITNFGNMLVAANCTALKPFKCLADTEEQIEEINLTGVTIGQNLYWEIDSDTLYTEATPASVTITEGGWKENLSITNMRGLSSTTLTGGLAYYTVSFNGICPAGTITFILYSDSSRAVEIARGTASVTSRWTQLIVSGALRDIFYWNSCYMNISGTPSYTEFTNAGDTKITTSIDPTSGIERFTFISGTDPGFGVAQVGDIFRTTGFADSNNNISGAVITAVTATYVEVNNPTGVVETERIPTLLSHAEPTISARVDLSDMNGILNLSENGTILIADSGVASSSETLTFNLYTYSAPNYTLVSSGTKSSFTNMLGTSQKLSLVGSTITGDVTILVKNTDKLKTTTQYIEIANETDTLLVRWCDPYDLTAWGQQSYEKLPPGGAGGILGTIQANGILYFLFENTIHRASLTGIDEFPLKFEYDVCGAGCPYPNTAFEYGGNLVFMAKDGTWKSFDGFKLITLSESVLTKLKGFAPTSAGYDTRFGIAYLNAGATGSEEKLMGCIMGSPVKFFEELHPYHMTYLCSGIDQVYATNLNGTTLSVVALNELSKTTVDLTATAITYEATTKEYIFGTKDYTPGSRIEGHVLRCTIYGDSNSTVVTVTPYVDGSALTAQDIILTSSGTSFEINRWASSLQLKIASKTGAASTTFKVYRIVAEIHNKRKI